MDLKAVIGVGVGRGRHIRELDLRSGRRRMFKPEPPGPGDGYERTIAFVGVNQLHRGLIVLGVHHLGDHGKSDFIGRSACHMDVAVFSARIGVLVRVVYREARVDSRAILELLDPRAL